MSDYGDDAGAPMAPRVETSRLAIFAILSGMICIPGLSGLLGVAFGLMALRQIARSQYLVGANLAWMGIITGLGNVVLWGAVASRYLSVRNQSDATVSTFVTAWAKGEAEGEAAAGPGLAPLMHHGRSEELRGEMLKRLGPFQSVGDRSDFSYRIKRDGISLHDEATATYGLLYQSGAPVEAVFDLGFTGSDLRVVGYRITSPVLMDMERDQGNEVHGAATPEISEFGSGMGKLPQRPMKGFNKH